MTSERSSDAAEQFLTASIGLLQQIQGTQMPQIHRAASLTAAALTLGRPLYVFGTGHSHMIAEEAYYRAGGLVAVQPLLLSGLMLHEDAALSTKLERLPGLAHALLERHPLGEGDVLVVASNSGANAVTVELATEAKGRGASVIAITSLNHATSSQARAEEGVRLHDLADVVLDNGGAVGDAAIAIEGFAERVAPTSTITAAVILNAIVAQTVANLVRAGNPPRVYTSANLSAGDAHNEQFDRGGSVQ